MLVRRLGISGQQTEGLGNRSDQSWLAATLNSSLSTCVRDPSHLPGIHSVGQYSFRQCAMLSTLLLRIPNSVDSPQSDSHSFV